LVDYKTLHNIFDLVVAMLELAMYNINSNLAKQTNFEYKDRSVFYAPQGMDLFELFALTVERIEIF